ncbi:HTH-type transcriptional repressor NanR [Brucella sp. NBRC 12952]|jgi:DNA-binding FadR family transcriptional regulator|uniref:Transcriptional regulator NanR n=2 Tax=Brucella pseudogrignonensis TaxID=419475 RepID=A0A7Y3T219_9HYPH|nr:MULTISPECIES: transcriptional regulator NanR [Brucella]EMG52818.1 transcriptional regulator NanR [Ochrobactrum sp. CDB2]MBK0023226.1 transcriptional regulator NanR [Ochrobactrum sp. S45]MBK0045404.1 transcriptional regulator NanR [Ochrobactrum sp. S46]MBO1025272.1 transcriptional regulator NanR [Ochrobactrum sp. SD129]KAB2688684.1 transcriptional regulator NanR [Brucella pseudogrignonensis]
MNKPMEPIVRRKLSDEVFDRLENMITSGELTPGDEMPSERVLMERFGVGRPAIREAMQSLAKMGLVSISHGERAKVLKLTARSILQQVDPTAKIMLAQSMDTLEHLKSARIFFERGIAREAALKASDKDVAELRAIVERQRDSLGDADAFISADMEFHIRIAKISGNPIFVAVSESMLAWLREYHTHMLIWTGKEKYTLVEHEEIVDKLAVKDADGAEAAMLNHLERSRALYTK